MAGEWIKVECSTPDKPEVFRAARKLGIDRDQVFGLLLRLWAWFDQNSVDGHVDGVTSTDVDGLVGFDGFCNAIRAVGWLEFDDDKETITLPNFDRHNGETAKKRALKNKRQARWRQNSSENVDEKTSTGASTREEKRREESKKPPVSPPSRKKRASQIPANFEPDGTCRKKAESLGMSLETELEKFTNHAQANGRTAKDWQAAFRNWLIKAAEFQSGGNQNPEKVLWRDAI